MTELVTHYNEERPHQARDNVPLPNADRTENEPQAVSFPSGEIKCRERIGGLLKHYDRGA